MGVTSPAHEPGAAAGLVSCAMRQSLFGEEMTAAEPGRECGSMVAAVQGMQPWGGRHGRAAAANWASRNRAVQAPGRCMTIAATLAGAVQQGSPKPGKAVWCRGGPGNAASSGRPGRLVRADRSVATLPGP